MRSDSCSPLVMATALLTSCAIDASTEPPRPGTQGPDLSGVASQYIVTITARANQQYVEARPTNDLLASRTGVTTGETYNVVALPGGLIALQSRVNLNYVSVREDDVLGAVAPTIGPWEQFAQIDMGDGYS